MAQLIRWERPRGSVHDVQRALAYGSDGCNVLVVSDACLYVLQNLIGLDATFQARWADEILENGYIPISDTSANYSAWVDLIERIQAEVIDVSCDWTTALETIATQQAETNTALADLITAIGDLQAAIPQFDYSDELGRLETAIQAQELCCGPISDRPYWPETPSDDPNPETSTFCDRAWSFARDWNVAAKELARKVIAGEGASVGLLALILAFAVPPVAILLAIFTIISQLVLTIGEGDLGDTLDSLIDDIACAIYTADSASEAKEAIEAILDAADWPTGMPVLAVTVLKYMVTIEALNTIFAETYPIRGDSASSDCQNCWPGDDLLRTAHSGALNVLEVGDSVSNYNAQDGSYGWRGRNPTEVRFYFTTGADPVAAVNIHVTFQKYQGSTPTTVSHNIRLASNLNVIWTRVEDAVNDFNAHTYEYLNQTVNLSANTQYVYFAQCTDRWQEYGHVNTIRVWLP